MPAYRIRKSTRAKHIRINVLPGDGIEVVVPKRSSIKQAKLFLQQNLDWVNKQLEQYDHFNTPVRPEKIYLPASNETWRVEYGNTIDNPSTGSRHELTEHGSCLSLSCAPHESAIIKKLLTRWLRRKAWQYFPLWLDDSSKTTGITYEKLSIRSQKTRWGSCSAAANISLNDRLLFLPFDTVEYVMIHELCHIEHLNHSKSYWDTVEKHCPEHRQHERLLKQAYPGIPAWAL